LSGGEILNLDFKVKWCWGLKEFCPGGYCCILGVGVMTAEELLERYATGERDFKGITIWAANFINADLRGIDLSGSNLKRVQMIAANLEGANLSGCILDAGDFTSATLRRSNFQKAILGGARLIGANCLEANFSETQMYRAFLDGANFMRGNLRNGDLGATSILGTSFINADMRGVNLDEARGSANFTGSNLSEAIIPEIETRLNGSIFDNAILPESSSSI
jgi:uncharacterized protein YjbI with pentapeptide repeats